MQGDDPNYLRIAATLKHFAFDWFVTEIFHEIPVKRDCSEEKFVQLTNRFDQPIQIDSEKRLYSELSGEGAVFAIEMVSDGYKEAVCLAQKADTVILALGCHPMVCAKEEIDRTTLDEKISKASPNAVCVLFSNYPYTIHTIQNRLPAILWDATGSQDMGTAMAKTLYGQNAPAGRLKMTWYKSDDDLPDIDDYDIVRHRRIYRYFDKEVLYPFGYGLTYTEFAYSNLSVQMADPCHIEISFDVKNIGECVSDEVVQIYASAPKSRVPKPRRQLLAFERLYDILPQETRHVTKRVNARFCETYDNMEERHD